MDFSVICPNDGPVEVSLENVATVILHGAETVDVVFTCPLCGEKIAVSAEVSNLLVAASDILRLVGDGGECEIHLEHGEPDFDDEDPSEDLLEGALHVLGVETTRDGRDELVDHYCEYFRRQLATIDTVEAMLHEIDCR